MPKKNVRSVGIFGSTGTIGRNALDLVTRFPDQFCVTVLVAGRNLPLLASQIRQFHPIYVSVQRKEDAEALSGEFPQLRIGWGEEGTLRSFQVAEMDVVVMGIVGFAALTPTLEAAKQARLIALANKEALVVAGRLLQETVKRSDAQLIPVDSEHNALFQLLRNVDRREVASLVLTASGGPLLRRPEIALSDVTPEIAINHPNWKMGAKISVDSATLMNKGLELIEACILFGVSEESVEVWVHPQSIVHGAVWLRDNSCLAQLSKPDMRSSIGYAMRYPERLESPIPKLTLKEMATLEFFEPDLDRFPALSLARAALHEKESCLIALNAANEVAVQAFLDRKLGFHEITSLVKRVLSAHVPVSIDSVEQILEIDQRERAAAYSLL